MKGIKESILSIEDYIIELRRYFHMYPELSWREVNTSKKIKEELDNMNIPYKVVEHTGIIATINGSGAGKTIGLRADMDALAITEGNDIFYCSRNEGIMHACGHDGHIAMLLGAAKILKEKSNEFSGKVILLFQPAEEVIEGAKAFLKSKELEEIDKIFSIHLWSDLDSGKISLEPGARMASADKFKITVEGKSGHGSAPHQGVDALVISSSIVMNLQLIISRMTNPLDPVVLSIGKIESGENYNIIARNAVLQGTIRTFNNLVRKDIEYSIEKVARGVADSFGAKVKVEYIHGTSPVINSEEASKVASIAAEKAMGKDAIVKMEKVMGGEDFALLLEEYGGALLFVGTRNEEVGSHHPHHNQRFNIDEGTLKYGVEVFVRIIDEYLSN